MPKISTLRFKEAILLAGVLLNFLAGCSSSNRMLRQTKSYAGRTTNIEHGEYEATVFDCMECHTVRQPHGDDLDLHLLLAGGVPIPGLEGSFAYSPNLTIASQYPAGVLENLIRGRLRYEFRMPTDLFNDMSADDMRDLVAYLKTLRPIQDRPLPDDRLPPNFIMPPPNPRSLIAQHEPATGTIARGRYLSKMLACQDCHSPRTPGGGYVAGELFQGGGFQMPLPNGQTLIAPNITPDQQTGIGSWSDDQIIRVIRTGITKDGRTINNAMPYKVAYHVLNDQDAHDLVLFLRTLTPVSRSWPASQ